MPRTPPTPTAEAITSTTTARFWWTGNGEVPENQADSASDLVARPVQRAFSGSVDRTGPLKWLHLVADTGPNCDGVPNLGFGGGETVEAASVPAGRNCFYVEMGLQGAIARDQDEPPIAFNLGDTKPEGVPGLRSGTAGSNLESEIQNGCGPCTSRTGLRTRRYCPNDNNPAALLGPHPAPWDASNDWPPPQCVVTQTGSGNQVSGASTSGSSESTTIPRVPRTTRHSSRPELLARCEQQLPGSRDTRTYDTYTFAQDRPSAAAREPPLRYPGGPPVRDALLHDLRLLLVHGQETFPIVGFGGFYVTGYGRTSGGGGSWQGGGPEDPCTAATSEPWMDSRSGSATCRRRI